MIMQSIFWQVTMIVDFADENAAQLKSKFYDIAYLFKGGQMSFLFGDFEPTNQRLLKVVIIHLLYTTLRITFIEVIFYKIY